MTQRPNGDSLRGHHAAATQRAVLTAARRVFGRQGYGETSVRELAEEAGVAVQTIYAHFGSKRGVAVALNSRLDEEAGVADAVRAIRESHQPVEVLAVACGHAAPDLGTGSDIVRIGRQAAMTGEPALWEEGQGAHRKGMAMIAAHLSGMKALRPGSTPSVPEWNSPQSARPTPMRLSSASAAVPSRSWRNGCSPAT